MKQKGNLTVPPAIAVLAAMAIAPLYATSLARRSLWKRTARNFRKAVDWG